MSFSWCSCPSLQPGYIRVSTPTHVEGDLALQSKHTCVDMECPQRVARYAALCGFDIWVV